MLEEDGLSFAVAEALEISNVMGQQFSGNFVESRKGEMYVFFLRIKFFPRIVISNRFHAFARESFSRIHPLKSIKMSLSQIFYLQQSQNLINHNFVKFLRVLYLSTHVFFNT